MKFILILFTNDINKCYLTSHYFVKKKYFKKHYRGLCKIILQTLILNEHLITVLHITGNKIKVWKLHFTHSFSNINIGIVHNILAKSLIRGNFKIQHNYGWDDNSQQLLVCYFDFL